MRTIIKTHILFSLIFCTFIFAQYNPYEYPADYGKPFASVVYTDDFQVSIMPYWYYNPLKRADTLNMFYIDYALDNSYPLSFNFKIFTVTAKIAANNDVIFGQQKYAVFARKGMDTTYQDLPAVRNTYRITYAATNPILTIQYDNIFFEKNGKAYQFGYAMDYAKRTQTESFANLYVATALYFYDTKMIKQQVKKITTPKLKYYVVNSNGRYVFKEFSDDVNIFIYDLNGKLTKIITNTNVWDGTDRFGRQLAKGFYVSNIKTNDGYYSIKILKK